MCELAIMQGERMKEEAKDLAELQDGMLYLHGMLAKHNPPDSVEFIDREVYQTPKMAISEKYKHSALKDFFDEWWKWETETAEHYVRMKKWCEERDYCDYTTFDYLACAVKLELKKICKLKEKWLS